MLDKSYGLWYNGNSARQDRRGRAQIIPHFLLVVNTFFIRQNDENPQLKMS